MLALGPDVPIRDPTPRGFRLRWMNILPRPTLPLPRTLEQQRTQEVQLPGKTIIASHLIVTTIRVDLGSSASPSP